MNIEKIKTKYCIDSRGAFGNEKNPLERHEKRKKVYESALNKGLYTDSEKRKKIELARNDVYNSIQRLKRACQGISLLINSTKNLENHLLKFTDALDMAIRRSRAENIKFMRQKESGIHS